MKNKKSKKRLVVIGGGMAGTACLEEIIALDPEAFEITVFGAEKRPNYNRVLLSQVLTGEKTLNDIVLHDEGWYGENKIDLHTGAVVTEIDRASRRVFSDAKTPEGNTTASTGYDNLILATGSEPFMPPIPGIEKKGVVAFRTIDDCESIRGRVKPGSKAVVIGGGLLGLEAAHGLLTLGAEVTVVHLADRLVERQLDDIAAELLKDDIERLGVEVLLGKETTEILGGDTVEGVSFSDGTTIPADTVVVSIGIKPNTALARASGIYCNKGVVVSDTMQTYDPSIYALGECVELRGETFGLVAPIFEQARVMANHLAGDSRLAFVSRPDATRLKVPGIELYSAGDVNGARSNRRETIECIEYIDRGSGVYKKLFIEDNRIAGIVMYGDTTDGPALFTSLLEGEDITQRRRTLLFGDGLVHGASSIEEMPGEAVVCGCNGVTKGAIVEAIEGKGLFTRAEVTRETKAGGSCGGCGSTIDRILEAVLGSSFEGGAVATGICECTKYSRDEIIRNIKEKRLRSVSDVMDSLGWDTVGCDTCRPAINYYVSMVWPLECVEDTSSRLVNERTHANIQEDGTFSVVPRMMGGVTTPEELSRIASVAGDFKVPLVKLTGGQRIDLLGVKREDLTGMWKALGMPSGFAYAKALRTVKTCVGERFCRYGTQDSLGLGVELEEYLSGLSMPAKVKLSVSGCPRNCAESAIKDLGVVGISGGFELYVGGCGGIELKAGKLLCMVRSSEEVKEVVAAFLQLYREEAHYGERTYKWVRRKGLEKIKRAVVEDPSESKALAGRLEEALSSVADPWIPAEKGEEGGQGEEGKTPG